MSGTYSSLLPSISKIFEKVILLQLTEHLDKNNILHQNQYGFRKNHSTELSSLYLVDYIYYTMDANEIPLNVYIDLSKAFDSLNHKILPSKLKFYVVTSLSLDLLYSYLSNRKQCMLYNNTFSDFIDIKQGVPQGQFWDHSCSQSTLKLISSIPKKFCICMKTSYFMNK